MRPAPAFEMLGSNHGRRRHRAKDGALQNALQQPAVLPCTGSQADLPAHKKTPVLQGFAAGCEVVQSGRVEDRGLEPQASSCRNTHVSGQGGAKFVAAACRFVSYVAGQVGCFSNSAEFRLM